jgi:hypothetical protein
VAGLPVFDDRRHHIGLGPAENADVYGFVITGQYGKQEQDFGAPSVFGGGESLISTPTLSRWTQDDLTGGAYQYTWGKDPKMFAESLNVLPSQFDRSVRSCPPMVPWLLHDEGGAVPIAVAAAGGALFAAFSGRIRRYDVATGAITHTLELPTHPCIGFAVDRSDRCLLVMTELGINRHKLSDLSFLLTAPAISAWGFPDKVKGTPFGLHASDSFILFSAGGSLWRLNVPDDRTASPADADWTSVGRLPGNWKAATTAAGMTYLLLADNDQRTSLVGTDGSRIIPVTEFPYNFIGQSLEVYGGRIYVGGTGQDFQGGDKYAELHEVTGTSVRLVRTWAPQVAKQIDGSRPKSIHGFGVHEGLLLFGDTGRCLVAYDLSSDGLFCGPEIQPPDGVREFRHIVSFRSRLYAYVHHPLDPAHQDGWYRVATAADVTAGRMQPFRAVVKTSDFAEEPDRAKRWSELRLRTRGAGPVGANYSLDAGLTWVDINGAVEQSGENQVHIFDLSTVPVAHQIRFQIRLERGLNVDSFQEYLGHTLSFSFLDTGKLAWSFTIANVSYVEGASDPVVSEYPPVDHVRGELWEWKRGNRPLNFLDLDGHTYRVTLSKLAEMQPQVLPMVAYTDVGGEEHEGRECFFSVTLLEV